MGKTVLGKMRYVRGTINKVDLGTKTKKIM